MNVCIEDNAACGGNYITFAASRPLEHVPVCYGWLELSRVTHARDSSKACTCDAFSPQKYHHVLYGWQELCSAAHAFNFREQYANSGNNVPSPQACNLCVKTTHMRQATHLAVAGTGCLVLQQLKYSSFV